MGKRSTFEKRPQDKYRTPEKAVLPLLPFLPRDSFTYVEPCAGDGRLITHLETVTRGAARCTWASDINPDAENIIELDALDLTEHECFGADLIITNPPWTRSKGSGQLLHQMIVRFAELRPTWLLFDADWMHNVSAAPFVATYLAATVSIGRVTWIEETKQTGKENCAWYLFHKNARQRASEPALFGRGNQPRPGLDISTQLSMIDLATEG